MTRKERAIQKAADRRGPVPNDGPIIEGFFGQIPITVIGLGKVKFGKEYWDLVERTARRMDKWPDWKKG